MISLWLLEKYIIMQEKNIPININILIHGYTWVGGVIVL